MDWIIQLCSARTNSFDEAVECDGDSFVNCLPTSPIFGKIRLLFFYKFRSRSTEEKPNTSRSKLNYVPLFQLAI